MKTLDSIIFDLDGTLWDTCPACSIGWNNVLQRHQINFREIIPDDVRSVAGRPHDECIRHVFNGLPESQIQLLINETMEEDNRMVDLHGGTLYPFVKEGLVQLREKHRLFIVSNCQSGYIETFLKYADLDHLFDDFECFGDNRESKSANIRRLIARNSIKSTIYIGDTQSDQTAAKEAGVPFGFVSYGFGKCNGSQFEFETFANLVKHMITSREL